MTAKQKWITPRTLALTEERKQLKPLITRSQEDTQRYKSKHKEVRHAFEGEKKVWFYIALYPVHWTAQSALHFPPLADLFIPTPFSASLGSILAMQQLRNDYSLTFPPLSIARYSFKQLSRLRRREVKENAQTSKRYQRGFEPGLSRLRVRHSTTEPPRSTKTRQDQR